MNDALRARRFALRARLSAVLMALLLASMIGCNQDRALAVRTMNKGLQAFNQGQTMTAIRHLKEAHQADPSYAEPALYLGQLYHREMSELDNAEQYYRQALQRDPENPDIAYKLGTVLADQGEHDDAAAMFEQTVQKNPKHAKGWFRLGLSQQVEGEYADSVDSLMKSIHANPRMKMDDEDPGGAAYHALGDLYTRFGFYDKALKVYENGIHNNKNVPRLYAGQGVAQLKLKRFEAAAQSFQKALEHDPRHVSATFNLAVALNAIGQHDKAIEGLQTYLSRAEDMARRTAAQGLLQKLKTDKEKSKE